MHRWGMGVGGRKEVIWSVESQSPDSVGTGTGAALALAKQLKLLLGAKSNIFQVLNKHTIKMPKSAVSPGVFPRIFISNPPSTYIYVVVEKKVDSLIFFWDLFTYAKTRYEELFLHLENEGASRLSWKWRKAAGKPLRSFREFRNWAWLPTRGRIKGQNAERKGNWNWNGINWG